MFIISMIKGLLAAIATYTIIPMPGLKWDDECQKYLLALFPACGLFIAASLYLLYYLRARVSAFIPFNVFYLLASVIPIIITGGIHTDGFMDTADALGSNAPWEKKLEIMKDPRCGAFGVIGLVVYIILYIAGMSLIGSKRQVLMVGTGFVLSRAFISLALMTLPNARGEGMASSMVNASKIGIGLFCNMLWIMLSAACAVFLYGRWGAAVIGLGLLFFFFFEIMAVKVFGGLTGDLAGWFICMYELIFVWMCGIIGFFWFL